MNAPPLGPRPWYPTPAARAVVGPDVGPVARVGRHRIDVVPFLVAPAAWLVAPAIAQAPALPHVNVDPPEVRGATWPGEATELLRWEEPVGFSALVASGADAGPLVFELLRHAIAEEEAGTIERLATYLRVNVDNAEVFRTVTDTDPLAALSFGLVTVAVRWVLDLTRTIQDAGPLLNGAPVGALPRGGAVQGWPWSWADLRYSWGSRYTEHHQAPIQGPAVVRLFAVITITGVGQGVTVTARPGGLCSLYKQAARGQTGAAAEGIRERR